MYAPLGETKMCSYAYCSEALSDGIVSCYVDAWIRRSEGEISMIWMNIS